MTSTTAGGPVQSARKSIVRGTERWIFRFAARSGAAHGEPGRIAREEKTARGHARGGRLSQRMGGIEPLTQAWEAGVLPLNYIRARTLYHGGGGMSRAVRKIFCLPVRFFAGRFFAGRIRPVPREKRDPAPHPAGPEKTRNPNRNRSGSLSAGERT